MASLYEQLENRLGRYNFNTHYNLSLKNRYLYTEIAKVACTTLKSNLGQREMVGLGAPRRVVEQHRNPHRPATQTPFVKPFQLAPADFDALMADGTFYKFCFVRNPFTRILSAYLDKIQNNDVQLNTLRRELAQMKGCEPKDVDGREVTFVEFLKAVKQKPGPAKVDRHFRLQSHDVAADIVPYDIIGRFEKFDADATEVLKKIGFKKLNLKRRAPHARRAVQRLGEFYDDQAQDLVREIYADDFKDFDYSLDLPA